MGKNITNTERIANELLLEKYKPLMVVQLSKSTTTRIGTNLEKFALDISKKTGYEVLLFPEEEDTSVKIVSVCESETTELEDLRQYIYEKYEKHDTKNIPFTGIKDIIKKRNEEK